MLRWKFGRALLWCCVTILVMPVLLLSAWYLIKFDIPYIHGGNVVLFRIMAALYWAVACFFIWGFELKNDK